MTPVRRLAGICSIALTLPLVAQVPAPRTAAPVPRFAVQHVIEVADLQASPGGAMQGQAVTFRFKLKNTGTTVPTSIPWALQVDGNTISAGNAPGLKAGDSWESSKGWTATPGQHVVRFVVDPVGTGGVSGAPAANRSRQIGYAVAALPATEVRLIDWDAAKAAGMTYADGLQAPTMCNAWLMPIANASYTDPAGTSYAAHVGAIHLGLSCSVTGGRMNATVFDNLQLRNGWRVKDVQVTRMYQTAGSDWKYNATPPAPGSDRPKVNIGLWANMQHMINLVLRVEIEGPRGTNPYR